VSSDGVGGRSAVWKAPFNSRYGEAECTKRRSAERFSSVRYPQIAFAASTPICAEDRSWLCAWHCLRRAFSTDVLCSDDKLVVMPVEECIDCTVDNIASIIAPSNRLAGDYREHMRIKNVQLLEII